MTHGWPNRVPYSQVTVLGLKGTHITQAKPEFLHGIRSTNAGMERAAPGLGLLFV